MLRILNNTSELRCSNGRVIFIALRGVEIFTLLCFWCVRHAAWFLIARRRRLGVNSKRIALRRPIKCRPNPPQSCFVFTRTFVFAKRRYNNKRRRRATFNARANITSGVLPLSAREGEREPSSKVLCVFGVMKIYRNAFYIRNWAVKYYSQIVRARCQIAFW